MTLALAATAFAGRADAQQRAAAPPAELRSRLWYEFTLGGAGSRLTCDICTAQRDVGAALTAAVGAYASPRVRVGLEVTRWTYLDAGVREHVDGLGVVAHLAPNPQKGLYLLGGAGVTTYRAGEFRYDAPRLSFGAGYDIPAFGKWVVGNVVTMDVAAFGELRSEGVTVLDRVGLSAVRAAVQLRRR